MVELFKNINWEYVLRAVVHASLLFASIYITTNPEYIIYSPVLVFLGSSIDSAR